MKKLYIISLLSFSLSLSIQGQIDRFSFIINGGDRYTLLKNTIPNGTSKESFGQNANFQFNLAISNAFGIGIGAGYSNYSSVVFVDNYKSEYYLTDDEGVEYLYRLSGTKINENQSIGLIETPFLLILQNQRHKKFKTYLQIGAMALLPINSNFNCTSGTIESRGYYFQYDVELKNLPNHGFDQCSLTGVSGKLLTQVGYAAIMELGANISVGRPYITIALFGSYGLSSICKQRELFTTELVYQSLSSVASSVKPYSVGVKVGISFPFNSEK